MFKSMRLLPNTLIILAFLFAAVTASALSGIPTSYSVAGKQLVLNGAGTRTKFIISVYNAGLYLPKKSNDAAQIIAADEPMAMRIKIVSGFASAAKMKNAIKEGFHKSTGGNTAPIQPQIDQLLKSAFSGEVNKGDTFDLVYIPGTGTLVLKNNKTLTTIKGLPFKQALFGIWLSDNPVQASLKKRLLGQ